MTTPKTQGSMMARGGPGGLGHTTFTVVVGRVPDSTLAMMTRVEGSVGATMDKLNAAEAVSVEAYRTPDRMLPPVREREKAERRAYMDMPELRG